MTFLIRIMTKLDIRRKDLDYNLLGASMVVIYFFFGYHKWFEYEAQALIPYIGHGPLIFLDVPGLRRTGTQAFSWGCGVDIRRALVRRVLEQEAGNSGCPRFVFFVYRNVYDHPIYARRLGRGCRWISGNDRACRFPHEGPSSSGCVLLFAASGRNKSLA